jgi:hypothetical protein
MTSPTRTLDFQAITRSSLRKFVALERFPSEGGTRPENEQHVRAVEGMKWNSTPVRTPLCNTRVEIFVHLCHCCRLHLDLHRLHLDLHCVCVGRHDHIFNRQSSSVYTSQKENPILNQYQQRLDHRMSWNCRHQLVQLFVDDKMPVVHLRVLFARSEHRCQCHSIWITYCCVKV